MHVRGLSHRITLIGLVLRGAALCGVATIIFGVTTGKAVGPRPLERRSRSYCAGGAEADVGR